MEIRKTNNGIEVEGYVNITGVKSHILKDKDGICFTEEIAKGVFSKALEKAEQEGRNIPFLYEHNPSEVMSESKKGTLKLKENRLGLNVRSSITDPKYFEVFDEEKGMSFGFRCTNERRVKTGLYGADEPKYHRIIEGLELLEVTATSNPAYETSVCDKVENRSAYDDIEYRTLSVIPKEKDEDKEFENWKKYMELRIRISKNMNLKGDK